MFSWLGSGDTTAQSGTTAQAPQEVAKSSYVANSSVTQQPVQRKTFDVDHVYVPIDPDVRAYQSTFDLDARLAERLFERKRDWIHVTLDDVAREWDELTLDKDVDDQLLNQIKSEFERLTQATVDRQKNRERTPFTPARMTEIEKRLRDDPSLQDEEDVYVASDQVDTHRADEVKKKLQSTYSKIKKTAKTADDKDLSQPTMHEIENRIAILRRVN